MECGDIFFVLFRMHLRMLYFVILPVFKINVLQVNRVT